MTFFFAIYESALPKQKDGQKSFLETLLSYYKYYYIQMGVKTNTWLFLIITVIENFLKGDIWIL